METMFAQDIEDLKNLYSFSKEELDILERVDKAADEIALPEFENYLNRKVNMAGVQIAKKHGILGLPVKKEYGGLGANALVTALAKERLGQVGLSFSSFYNVHVFLTQLALQRWGNDYQKEKYLKPASKGDIIMAFGLTEPDAGSDPSAMQTTYEKRGDKFVLNGSKYLITNGSIANNEIIFAKSKENKGEISAFIIDTKSNGFSVSMQLKEKIGLFASDTSMLDFKGLEVPKEDVLGEIGKGMHVAYSSLMNGRMGVASASVGVIEDCLNAVLSRAKERVQFGKQIGKHQLIQKHIVKIAQNLEMARWPTYFAAIRKIAYEKDPDNKDLEREIDKRTALAKKIASYSAWDSADHAVQGFGGFGYSLFSPVGRHYCDTRVTRLYEGSDEIMELKIAAHLLGDDFKAFN